MNLLTRTIRTLCSLEPRNGAIGVFVVGLVTSFIGLPAPACAGLVLTIGPEITIVARPTAGPATSITLTAYLAADVGTESVADYTVPIDLGPPSSVGSPIGMTLTGAAVRTVFPGSELKHQPLVDPFGIADYLVGSAKRDGNPQPVDFDTSPSALFDFTISIDSSVALGDYSAGIVGGVLFGFAPDLTDKVQIGPAAVIRVVAVPEPTALGMLGLLAVPFMLRRQRLSQTC